MRQDQDPNKVIVTQAQPQEDAMALRSTLGAPSRFEGEVSGLHVTGEYEGKECRVSVKAGSGAEATVTRVTVIGPGRVTVRIKKRAKDGPAILPFLGPKPYDGNGKAKGPLPTKRTFLLDESGEIEHTTIRYLTEQELERETAGPPDRLVQVNSRKLPFGVCVEYTSSDGKLVRTEWSKRFEIRRAA